jgi:hypothetical protein
MNIAFLEFGNLSSFDKIMNNNLTLLENNIIELKKFFNINQNIDIYILTEKKYDNEIKIKLLNDILFKHSVTLRLLNYWDDLINFHPQDNEANSKYKNIFNINQYGYDMNNPNHHPWGYDSKQTFNPGNLWFRRYANFNLFKKYIEDNNLNYDLVCLTRLFSTKIINLKSIFNFNKDYLYFSYDTLFIGTFNNIEKLLEFGKKSLFVNNNVNNKPALLNNNKFLEYSKTIDIIIFNHIFSSEIQILYYIYTNFNQYKNLRFPMVNYISNKKIHELTYTDNYNEEYLKEECFKIENCNLFVVISR